MRLFATGALMLSTSCTTLLMDSGEVPARYIGASKNSVDDTFGPPETVIMRSPALTEDLSVSPYLASFTDDYAVAGLYAVNEPIPEQDVTKSLQALYLSVFTLGLADIITAPPVALQNARERSVTRYYIFLFDPLEQVLAVLQTHGALLERFRKDPAKDSH